MPRSGRVAYLALAWLVGCSPGSETVHAETEVPTGPRIIHLPISTVDRYRIRAEEAGIDTSARMLRVSGTLTYNADRYAEIGPTLEGRVDQVKVDVGQHVKAGQVLAVLSVPAVAELQAEYHRAQIAVEVTRKNQERQSAMLEYKVTTAREVELAGSDASNARATLAATEVRMRALGIDAAHAASLGPGHLGLISPIEGVVVQRELRRGQYLLPSVTAFVVADLSEMWAILNVYESDVAYLEVGAPLELSVDALGGARFPGKLALIEPAVGSTSRVARARVVLPNTDGRLRPNVFVRAEVQLAPDASGTIAVPTSAVQPNGSEDAVFVEHGPGAYELRSVKVARRTPQVAEIQKGLVRGERLVVDGAFLLRGELARQ